MCLGIPGRIVRWIDRDPIFARAEVEFEGVRRECHMACVPDADEGEYVIVHAGIAICTVDATEAGRVLAELGRLDLLESWPPSGVAQTEDADEVSG
jgi:hydrogenase expression/formation protein HypC